MKFDGLTLPIQRDKTVIVIQSNESFLCSIFHAVNAMPHLAISLLGPCRSLWTSKRSSGFAYNKARALLAYLAVEAHHPQQRDMIVGLLWPDMPDARRAD